MPTEIKLPPQSAAVRAAAKKIGAPVAVLITMSADRGHWETRVYGSTERGRYLGGYVADALLASLLELPTPADGDEAFKILSDVPGDNA